MNNYPVITYSISDRTNVYQKFGRLKTFWRLLTFAEPILIGHNIKAEIVVCAEAYRYLSIMDIIQIRQMKWIVSDKPCRGTLRIRTAEPTRQLFPIQIGYPIIKLFSTVAEGGKA